MNTYFGNIARFLLWGALLCGWITGCGKSPSPEFRFNEAEFLRLEKSKFGAEGKFSPDYRRQIGNLTTALFGLPDDPRIPDLGASQSPFQDLFTIDKLKAAAGPVASEQDGKNQGLYRKHCAHCHGISGDGAGPTALTLNPYPRDFRLGKFKFKSTPLRTPPLDSDLSRVIRNGIPGTAMPSFQTLKDEEVDALVDYIKYLTVRGEFERKLLDEASNRDGEPLYVLSSEMLATGVQSEIPESLAEQLYELVGDFLLDEIIGRWLDRDTAATPIPPPPPSLALDSPEFSKLVEMGQVLFAGKANCIQCHGQTGLGDGQLSNYDDWTNHWAKTPGVDLTVRATYQDFLDAGVLPPRTIRPRNLNFAIYRGGNSVGDLYLRIKNGIEGTPMPSSIALNDDEIWALVAFVKSLPFLER